MARRRIGSLDQDMHLPCIPGGYGTEPRKANAGPLTMGPSFPRLLFQVPSPASILATRPPHRSYVDASRGRGTRSSSNSPCIALPFLTPQPSYHDTHFPRLRNIGRLPLDITSHGASPDTPPISAARIFNDFQYPKFLQSRFQRSYIPLGHRLLHIAFAQLAQISKTA
jgi:hypothetical protein